MARSATRKPEATPVSDLSDAYRRVWGHSQYRRYAPGEHHLVAMLEVLRPSAGASFIDFGCGTGRAAREMQRRGFGVLGVDFADNCLDPEINIPFLIADLTRLPQLSAQFGYCTDVMEHIEPEQVDSVLSGIHASVREAVAFSIALVPDSFGPILLGEPLHLTVKDSDWWRTTLQKYWPEVEILDSPKNLLLAICRKPPKGFVENADGVVNTACNTSADTLLGNVRINAARDDVPWLQECHVHDRHAVLVGGGPSLAGSIDEIRRRVDDGQDIFALNGAAQFLIDHGITPDYLVMIDGRQDNVRFVKNQTARAYIIASQCHPDVFDALKGRDVRMMHLVSEGLVSALPKGRIVTPVCGIISVGLSAMSAAVTAGYRLLHLYGYDSSDDDGHAHAYAQQQTASEAKRLTVWRAGQSYRCSYAMFAQAEAFEQFASMLANDFNVTLTVHGRGLLPDIAREMTRNHGEPNDLCSE